MSRCIHHCISISLVLVWDISSNKIFQLLCPDISIANNYFTSSHFYFSIQRNNPIISDRYIYPLLTSSTPTQSSPLPSTSVSIINHPVQTSCSHSHSDHSICHSEYSSSLGIQFHVPQKIISRRWQKAGRQKTEKRTACR